MYACDAKSCLLPVTIHVSFFVSEVVFQECSFFNNFFYHKYHSQSNQLEVNSDDPRDNLTLRLLLYISLFLWQNSIFTNIRFFCISLGKQPTQRKMGCYICVHFIFVFCTKLLQVKFLRFY